MQRKKHERADSNTMGCNDKDISRTLCTFFVSTWHRYSSMFRSFIPLDIDRLLNRLCQGLTTELCYRITKIQPGSATFERAFKIDVNTCTWHVYILRNWKFAFSRLSNSTRWKVFFFIIYYMQKILVPVKGRVYC